MSTGGSSDLAKRSVPQNLYKPVLDEVGRWLGPNNHRAHINMHARTTCTSTAINPRNCNLILCHLNPSKFICFAVMCSCQIKERPAGAMAALARVAFAASASQIGKATCDMELMQQHLHALSMAQTQALYLVNLVDPQFAHNLVFLGLNGAAAEKHQLSSSFVTLWHYLREHLPHPSVRDKESYCKKACKNQIEQQFGCTLESGDMSWHVSDNINPWELLWLDMCNLSSWVQFDFI